MRKVYLLCTGILLTATVTAQVNLNFEAPITHPYAGTGFPQLAETTGWRLGLYTAETANPGEGAQSCKLITTHDPNLAAAMQNPSDTLTGFIQRAINGAISNPQNIDVEFRYNYTPVNNDWAVFLVEVFDTLQAGFNDDVVLYQKLDTLYATSGWSTSMITTLPQVGNGTPNRLFLGIGSSIGGLFPFDNFVLPSPGSTLLVDAIVIHNYTPLGTKENKLEAVKVYPNPTADVLHFNLENAEATAIHIYSLDGKHLLFNAIDGMDGSIDVSSLNAGMYFYEITTSNGTTLKNTFIKN